MKTTHLSYPEMKNRLLSRMCKRCRIMPGQVTPSGSNVPLNSFFRSGMSIYRRFVDTGDVVVGSGCDYLTEVVE